MAKTLTSMGAHAYLDEVYAKEGGSERLKKLLTLGWPKARIADEYGISRFYLNRIIEKLEEEEKANA